MPNSENTNSIDQQQGSSMNQLDRVKQLTLKPESQVELSQILLKEMKSIDSKFDALNIGEDHIFHYPKFGEVVSCFEKNLPILSQMMYVVGKSGNDQVTNAISSYITGRIQHVTTDSRGTQRDVESLKILPLVSVVTGYSLGLLDSQKYSTFHKILKTKTGAQNSNSRAHIADYLLSHVWEGRDNRLWKYHIPEGSKEPSSSLSEAHNEMLTRMAFLNYFNDKLSTWLSGELESIKVFKNLLSEYKILGSLIYLEKFKDSEIKKKLYNGGELDNTIFKFEHNVDFFDRRG